MNENKKGAIGGWVLGAVVVALIIIIGWFIWTDEDQEVRTETQEAAQETEAEFDQAAAEAEARAELLALQTRAEVTEDYDAIADEVADVRAALEEEYEEASAEVRAEFNRDIAPAFERLENALREGTGDVAEFFAALFLAFEADVRSDEE